MNVHKSTSLLLTELFFACIMTGASAQDITDSRKAKATNERPESQDVEIAGWLISEYNQQIAIARLAKQKATNEVIRQFADKIVKDHKLAKEKFSKWASDSEQADPNLVVSPESTKSDVFLQVSNIRDLDRESLSTITRSLTQSSGKDFDRNFMDAQVRFHRGLRAADRVLASLASPACRSKVEECLEKDVEHLKESNQIIKWMGSAKELQTAQK